jgi:RHS repeat-associated protein
MNRYTYTPQEFIQYDPAGNAKILQRYSQADFDRDGHVDQDDVDAFRACITGPTIAATGACVQADFDGDNDVDVADYLLFQPQLAGPTANTNTQIKAKYDYRNQMIQFIDGAIDQTHRYRYDAIGRRIAKILDVDGAADTVYYLYDGSRVIEEQDTSGTTLATYIYGEYVDDVIQMKRGSAAYYYHTDDLHNVMAVTDSTGAVVERYDYGDYGLPTVYNAAGTEIAGTAIDNPYLFNSRRYDPETGWYYYRTRYLDPIAGRFTTRDTIGIWGDAMNLGNAFTYVGSNPWTLVDPFGLWHWYNPLSWETSVSEWLGTKFWEGGHAWVNPDDGILKKVIANHVEETKTVVDTITAVGAVTQKVTTGGFLDDSKKSKPFNPKYFEKVEKVLETTLVVVGTVKITAGLNSAIMRFRSLRFLQSVGGRATVS